MKQMKVGKSMKLKETADKKSGITLIALVITIIVLLILASVSIAMLTGENGIITQAQKAKEATEKAQKDEEAQLTDIEDYINSNTISTDGYNEADKVNAPKLKAGMIPVYYDYDKEVWKKADEKNTNKQWYNYDAKQWANIVTVADSDSYLRDAEVGTEIPMDKITTFFVWIPRYAYSITSGYKEGYTNTKTGSIKITFLKGNTNVGVDGVTYSTDYDETKLNAGDVTPTIVHPGFTFGNSQVNGIWVAKFEASGTNESGDAVGNRSSTSSIPVAVDSSTFVKVVPSVASWRDITIGESEYQSIKMSSNTTNYGWTSAVNSHLIKNDEWGAVAYMCYSDYGRVPNTNGSGSYNSTVGYYNLYTGAGPKAITSKNSSEDQNKWSINEGRYEDFTEDTHGYNTENGVLSSTTGNVYGVYDMAGGAWERVAAYLDNKNGNLSYYGKSTTSTSDGEVKYFTSSNELDTTYSIYWNAYKVSDEERNNQIVVEIDGEKTTLTQGALWGKSGTDAATNLIYNIARKRITDATYNSLPKGIGVTETASSYSYYGVDKNGNYNWLINENDEDGKTSTTWNNDYVLIGHTSGPFVYRGGNCNSGSNAGVLCTGISLGYAYNNIGFRPALVF
jgi:type II secretory pathway pseudopilin PulG